MIDLTEEQFLRIVRGEPSHYKPLMDAFNHFKKHNMHIRIVYDPEFHLNIFGMKDEEFKILQAQYFESGIW